jgi:hypothetical protein
MGVSLARVVESVWLSMQPSAGLSMRLQALSAASDVPREFIADIDGVMPNDKAGHHHAGRISFKKRCYLRLITLFTYLYYVKNVTQGVSCHEQPLFVFQCRG